MKSTEKYSIGPWRVVNSSVPNSSGRLIVEDFGGRSVCATSLRGVDGNIERMEANANVIASAPDMLEILKWLDNEMDCRDDDGYGVLFLRQDFEKVRKVIARAESGIKPPIK